MVSIYIHIPFCIRKCNYCDFLSFEAPTELKDRYVDALCNEIKLSAGYINDQVCTIFFGGGTPSILTPVQLDKIMEAVRTGFDLSACTEISLECNPGTATADKLRSYRDMGINRLSIGLQSANDNELNILGRIHDFKQFQNTYNAARQAGFGNLNVDIISAIPGQSTESYRKTLTEVVNHDPEHISAYSLIIEEGTKFHDLYDCDSSVTSSCTESVHRPDRNMSEEKSSAEGGDPESDLMKNPGVLPKLPNEDDERRMYYMTKDVLEKAGYHRYEISNYARPGYECRHNNVYWTGGDYLGLGLGASSYIGGIRFKDPSDIKEYIQLYKDGGVRPGVGEAGGLVKDSDAAAFSRNEVLHREIDVLTPEDMMEEYMFLGLRRMEGVSAGMFSERFGRNIYDVYGNVLKKAQEDGLLIRNGDMIALTDRGIDVSNVVLSNFLLD